MEYRGEEIEPEAVIEAVVAILLSMILYFVFISPLLVSTFPILSVELVNFEEYPRTLNAYLGVGFVFASVVGWLIFRGYANVSSDESDESH